MTLSSVQHREFLGLIKEFTNKLNSEAEHRDERQQRLSSGELAWAAHERDFMRDLVNAARADRGAGPVDVARIEAVEQLAAGHSNYTSKFAMYCAELVFGERS
ncbi:Uncharacterised protein (plasmid) [Tsukamurella tyrosinosolvens]|uniref:Uncharacterized protein n=1 Tax=Tsukamurella tyrosinosolvens TaxID=57704 RepID=A0A1H4UCS9_TSUTY|nr:hypothetical protein [Tsukamurella tyrosinosolvens]KXO92955.1 hypothetical protein AXK58_13880 [Tsukamurella tyrosinosolvens]SEC66662.1 hypothetical protein SAMN04489793_2861 [Tsukamurella tyrosinosolvens]VEH94144.1 Uncharacterised protein [Tsukamurella tyrosinosolvens]